MFQQQNKLKLDIVISGYDEDKDKIKNVIGNIQSQLDNIGREDVSAMFALGNKKDNNLEEIRNNAINTMLKTEYYTVLECVENFDVMPNYIQSLLRIIEQAEEENNFDALEHYGLKKL